MKKLTIKLPSKTYDIVIEKGLRYKIGEKIKELCDNKKIYVVTDENVYNIYGDELSKVLNDSGIEPLFTVVKPGEQSKSMEVLQNVYDDLLDKEITRTDMILALGGGVVGDLTGFVASTLLRGIRFIQMPTSLLAQIDSSVGGKVAVNLDKGKNLVGSFYHPDGVFIDSEMLSTLEKRFLYDGTAEVIKYGCIKSLKLFEILEKISSIEEYLEKIDDIIYICCNIKREVVEEDEKDMGNRMLLNFGHTLGHGVEKYFNYEKYTHGEAVAIGMYNIIKRHEEISKKDNKISNRLKTLIEKYNLPFEMPKMESDHMKSTIGLDKKTSGSTIKIVLLDGIGKSYLKKMDKEEIINYI